MTAPTSPDTTRPPNQPPTNPPPSGPKKYAADPIAAALRAAVAEIRLVLARLEAPARLVRDGRDPASSEIATPGGPVTFSAPRPVGPPRFESGEHRLVGRVRVWAPGYDALPEPGIRSAVRPCLGPARPITSEDLAALRRDWPASP